MEVFNVGYDWSNRSIPFSDDEQKSFHDGHAGSLLRPSQISFTIRYDSKTCPKIAVPQASYPNILQGPFVAADNLNNMSYSSTAPRFARPTNTKQEYRTHERIESFTDQKFALDSSDLRKSAMMASMTANAITPSTSGHHQTKGGTHRHQRNQAEKNRRDELNILVDNVAKQNPITANEPRKLDRNTNLRLAGAHLQRTLLARKLDKLKPTKGTECMLVNRISELYGQAGVFHIVTDREGLILEVSAAVQHLLGYQQIDMLNCSILEFVHEAEQDAAEHMIRSAIDDAIKQRMSSRGSETKNRKTFSINCRMLEKTQQKGQQKQFQWVHVNGYIACITDRPDLKIDPENDFVVVATVRILATSSPLTRISFMDSNQYITFHDRLGVILYVDHRISNITGHMPREVINMSAHNYMNDEDRETAILALGKLLQNGEGSVVYRLQTKTMQYIHLQSTGFVQTTNAQNGVMFLCTNTLLDEENGPRQRLEFQSRFQPQKSGERFAIEATSTERSHESYAQYTRGELPEESRKNEDEDQMYLQRNQNYDNFKEDAHQNEDVNGRPIGLHESHQNSGNSAADRVPMEDPCVELITRGRRSCYDDDSSRIAPKRRYDGRISSFLSSPVDRHGSKNISTEHDSTLTVIGSQLTPNSSPLNQFSDQTMNSPVSCYDRMDSPSSRLFEVRTHEMPSNQQQRLLQTAQNLTSFLDYSQRMMIMNSCNLSPQNVWESPASPSSKDPRESYFQNESYRQNSITPPISVDPESPISNISSPLTGENPRSLQRNHDYL